MDGKWLEALGKHIGALIKKKGYGSPYEFWIEKAGDHLSRSALNYILTGKTDPKATTLRVLSELLEVNPKDILNFDDSA